MHRLRTRRAIAMLAVVLGAVLAPMANRPADAVTAPGVAATRLPVPSDAIGSGQPAIMAMSCGEAAFCVAVGYYYAPLSPSGQGPEPLIETWSGGTWTATRGPIPAGGTGVGSLSGVSCSGTTCAAYGSYPTGPSTSAYMGLMRSGAGVWTAYPVSPPTNDTFLAPSSGATQALMGVGCSGAGACALVGNADNASNQLRGWAASFQNGGWSVHETNTPIDATGQASWLHGISCGGGVCQGAGGYVSTAGYEPLIVTVNADGSTNSPSSHVPIPQGATEISDIGGVACDGDGICAAYGTYYTSGGSNAEALVMPVGGTAFQPQAPPTLTAESTAYHPAATLWSAGCAGGSCVVVGNYYDTGNQPHPLIDRFSAGGGVADTPPNDTYVDHVACGGAAFCTAFGSSTYGAPIDVLTGSGWVAAPLAVPSDGVAYAAASAQEEATACDSSTSCWVLGAYQATSGQSQETADFAAHVTPTPVATGPSVTASTLPAFALGSSATFSWHGTAGSSPISHYVVQVRRAAWNGGFGSWVTPSAWSALSAATTHVSVPLPVGDDTCVRVEAVDAAAHGSWSSVRCADRPLDDHSLAASSGWARATGVSGFYLSTYSSTKTDGAVLTRTSAEFDRVALVATKCATCGKVAVYSGTTLLGTVNLYRATTLREAIVVLPTVSLRTATLRLRVVTSGKLAQVDGLGISRS